MPANNDRLRQAAAAYYQCLPEHIAVGVGSQEFIQLIPRTLVSSSVALPAVAYQEHNRAWQQVGHRVCYYRSYDELLALIEGRLCQHVVVINPNNPTAEKYTASSLLELHRVLAGQGVLLVDEAFVDSEGENSLSAYTDLPGLYVLRSLGKFFGLAGLRLSLIHI